MVAVLSAAKKRNLASTWVQSSMDCNMCNRHCGSLLCTGGWQASVTSACTHGCTKCARCSMAQVFSMNSLSDSVVAAHDSNATNIYAYVLHAARRHCSPGTHLVHDAGAAPQLQQWWLILLHNRFDHRTEWTGPKQDVVNGFQLIVTAQVQHFPQLLVHI